MTRIHFLIKCISTLAGNKIVATTSVICPVTVYTPYALLIHRLSETIFKQCAFSILGILLNSNTDWMEITKNLHILQELFFPDQKNIQEVLAR